MRTKRRLAQALICAFTFLLAGCSFFDDAPPAGEAAARPVAPGAATPLAGPVSGPLPGVN